MESVKINLLGRPSAFIRKEINTKGGLSDEAKETLRVLVERNDRKMASQDIAREEYLRQKRMKKLEERQRKIDRMNGRMRENGTRSKCWGLFCEICCLLKFCKSWLNDDV